MGFSRKFSGGRKKGEIVTEKLTEKISIISVIIGEMEEYKLSFTASNFLKLSRTQEGLALRTWLKVRMKLNLLVADSL